MEYLDEVGEGDADHHEFGDDFEEFLVDEHAVLHAALKQLHVQCQHLVDVLNRAQTRLEVTPVRFDHLEHHVVLEVLHEVEHALSQREGGSVPAR